MKTYKLCDSAMLRSLYTWLDRKNTPAKRALIGFDGYVDSIYRVVQTRTAREGREYYQSIRDYGQRIMDAAGKNADIEIKKIESRMGGNAPLMAEGVAALGDTVALMGELGYPQLNLCFQQLPESMQTFSFADPCQTIALEFMDGKIMMGDIAGSESLNWETIKNVVGLSTMRQQVQNADLVAVLNWSAHAGIPQIAQEVTQMALESPCADSKRIMFFDLSDPNALSGERLSACLNIIADIGKRLPTVLGMNENEVRAVICRLFSEAYPNAATTEMLRLYGRRLFAYLNLSGMTIHTTSYALGFDANETWYADGFRVDKPLISTGAGDHYNAAFCHGLLHDLPMPQCLLMGCLASSFYVLNGRSASCGDLRDYIPKNCESAV